MVLARELLRHAAEHLIDAPMVHLYVRYTNREAHLQLEGEGATRSPTEVIEAAGQWH